MLKIRAPIVAACFALAAVAGCVSLKAPEQINIGSGNRGKPIDSSRVPKTSSHEECRDELARAYEEVRYLEEKNRKLKKKHDKLKDELGTCEDRVDDLEDRLGD